MQYLTDFDGHRILVTEERLVHIREHPEMVGMETAIAETLGSPQQVVRSVSDPHARLYYRFYSRTRVGGKWLCVVVKAGRTGDFVVTAYLTDHPKQGAILWPRSP